MQTKFFEQFFPLTGVLSVSSVHPIKGFFVLRAPVSTCIWVLNKTLLNGYFSLDAKDLNVHKETDITKISIIYKNILMQKIIVT